MGVSENRGTPKSSILIGCSIINRPFFGTSSCGNTHIKKTYPWRFNIRLTARNVFQRFSSHETNRPFDPKGKDHLPTIDFQRGSVWPLCSFQEWLAVSFRQGYKLIASRFLCDDCSSFTPFFCERCNPQCWWLSVSQTQATVENTCFNASHIHRSNVMILVMPSFTERQQELWLYHSPIYMFEVSFFSKTSKSPDHRTVPS